MTDTERVVALEKIQKAQTHFQSIRSKIDADTAGLLKHILNIVKLLVNDQSGPVE